MKRKKSNLLNFFSFVHPVCSVCVTIYPLYLVLLISLSLISWFGNWFLQVFEKKENKDLNHTISKPKLFKVIPHCLRICSRLGETQIRPTKLPQIHKIWVNFYFKQGTKEGTQSAQTKHWADGQSPYQWSCQFFLWSEFLLWVNWPRTADTR